jgi:hypothetical protein
VVSVGGLHDAAFRAGVWQVIEQRAKELKDAAKVELDGLEVGDTVAGRIDGQIVAKATKTKGRSRIVVTDPVALLAWVREHHPTEIVESVNPAFMQTFTSVGDVVIWQGEPVDFMAVEEGSPYITVRKDKDAPMLVAQLLTSGRLSLDGVKQIELEPADRYSQDQEAGAL